MFAFAPTYAALEDNSIEAELDAQKVKTLNTDFKLKSFESCQNMEDVMGDYIKDYWKNNKQNYYRYPMMLDDVMFWSMEKSEDAVMETSVVADNAVWGAVTSDFSQTNNQVAWVDESDIIKTDGKYIYYFNDSDSYVYIVSVANKEIVKKIKVPKTFYSPILYLGNNTLTILSSWYSNQDYSAKWYYINRNDKTYVIVFNIADVKAPKLDKLYITDWSLTQSRKIGDYIYVISNNYFNIPYYTFKSEDDIDFSVSDIMPQ